MEVDVLGSPSPISLMDLCGRKAPFNEQNIFRAQELCESGGGRTGLPVLNKPCDSVDVKQH